MFICDVECNQLFTRLIHCFVVANAALSVFLSLQSLFSKLDCEKLFWYLPHDLD